MKSKEMHWKAKDGIEMFGILWEPENAPVKAVINLVHGMGEHCARYAHVAQRFTAAGYAVLGFDHRGHGRSGGGRGHVPSFETLMDDIAILLEQSKKLYPKVPQVLYAHSMGGGAVASFLIKRNPDVKAAVLSAPYFRLAFSPPAIKIFAGKLMENILPKLTLPTGLDPKGISRDLKEVEKYIKDPLVHDKISAKMGMEMINNGEFALANADKIKVPVLILHGTADALTSHEASKEFATKAGNKASLKLLPGLFHEIHNEPEKEAVISDIIQWFDKHI
jgi:alpha-beta hydrolase superfamily lysophospholipase